MYPVRHEDHQLRLDVDRLDVLLVVDLAAGVQLALVQDLVLLERRDDVRLEQLGEGVDRRLVVEQAAARRLLLPLLRVVVPVEDDPLVLLDRRRQERADRFLELLTALDRLSSSVETWSSASVTATFSAMFGNAMLWLADTARNSNLLPVNANGLVRLRSPASRGSFGSTDTPDRGCRRSSSTSRSPSRSARRCRSACRRGRSR